MESMLPPRADLRETERHRLFSRPPIGFVGTVSRGVVAAVLVAVLMIVPTAIFSASSGFSLNLSAGARPLTTPSMSHQARSTANGTGSGGNGSGGNGSGGNGSGGNGSGGNGSGGNGSGGNGSGGNGSGGNGSGGNGSGGNGSGGNGSGGNGSGGNGSGGNGSGGNGSGNNASGSWVYVIPESPGYYLVLIRDWNGSLVLNTSVEVISYPTDAMLVVDGTVTDQLSPVRVYANWNGPNATSGAWNATEFSNGSEVAWMATVWNLTAPGNYSIGFGAVDGTQSVGYQVPIPVVFGGAGGNASCPAGSTGSNTSLIAQGPPVTTYLLKAWSGSFCLTAVVGIDENSTAVDLVVSNVTLSGTTSSQVFVGVAFGNGKTISGLYPSNGSVGTFSSQYTPGNYTLVVNVSNWALNATTGPMLTAVLAFQAQYSVGGNASGAYPAAVSVWVGATPVTGPAPLATTLSAYISGGSPPFLVTWSLPGSSVTTNASGLMVSVSYATAGWYPATAFVYNTTNAYGVVLVGEGGVWIYASGSGGNGSSGNGSPNGSGATPISGGKLASGAVAGEIMTAGIVAVVVAGALLGGLGGFFAGRRTSRIRTPAVFSEESETEDFRRT
jgi:hypothetical protein